MHTTLKRDYAYIHKVYMWLQEEVEEIRKIYDESTLEERADINYALREMHFLLDSARKDVNKLFAVTQMIAVNQITERGPEFDKIETVYCSAQAKVSPIPKIPSYSKERERYDAVMTELFNVSTPKELIEKGVIQTRWKGFCNFVAEQMQNGKAMKSLNNSETSYNHELSIRKRKAIAE